MPRRAGLDRRAVVAEAAALADERGLDHVTLANLAERLNVRTPSLYNHIEGIDDLHRQLSLFAVSALGEAVARASIGRNGPEGLVAVANAYRAFAKRHPGLYGATLRAPHAADEEMQRLSGTILDVLRAVLSPFRLPEDHAVDAMRGFRSLIHGFVSLEAVHGFGLAQSIDKSFQAVVSSYIGGLANADRLVELTAARL